MTEKTKPARPSLATFLKGPANAAKPAAPESAPAAAASDDTQATLALDLALPANQPELMQPDVEPAAAEQAVVEQAEAAHVEASQPGLVTAETAAISDSAVIEDAEQAEDDASPAAAAPSFARESRAPTAPAADTPRWQWGLVLALALLLGLQIILADRARLAADAGTRPLVSGLCTVLRCSLPAWHEPSAFSMLSRDIRPVPGQAGALQVQTSFRNDARWAQAWPALRLSLSDADGRVIGRRTLQPAEYLGPGADPLARLEPGQSAQVSFRLREPAAATVAFSFEFQ